MHISKLIPLNRAWSFHTLRVSFFALALTGLCLAGFAGTRSLTHKTNATIVARSKERDYKFDATISRNVLENYLDRSITMQSVLVGKGDFNDNLRMIKNIGAKFIGRSVCQWGEEADISKNLQQEKELAEKVHESDPDIILQACIFEIVTIQVDQLAIPEWAFTALGVPVEKRNFSYAAMLYPDGKFKNQWGRGSVPDVSQLETKLYFYYLAVSYINIGIESIHFGQVELMNKNDPNLDNYNQVLTLIRSYAAKHARRHIILCDSHVPSGGFVRNGKLLMDFHAFPLRIMETPGQPEEATLKVGHTDALYGRSKGGITPSGWSCEHLPYLVEFDNYGVSKYPGKEKAGDIPFWVWGYDEISWFAHQSKQYRTQWLIYAYNWVKKTDPNGHLEMPGGRQTTSPLDHKKWYYANGPGTAVPDGQGDEDTIREIWATGGVTK
jgi:hypothetical protein